ncbi:hypothetical protein ABOM_008150 [Aspergillus bombycis]|uniref:Uncharacterized protein n=1 Tax=Aspergillus bombycis TaxID=109264 RepID=A0A1F7ZU07_9EURO|nr:hypothetical protein ABOM_008150 [Aspergillus bombycis]OGM42769.1 hypothetical protein ABOM_008150 [Aspergillus bombycis]
MALSTKRPRFFFHPRRPSLSPSESSSQLEQPLSIVASTSAVPLQAPKPSSSATEQAAELLKITSHIRTQLQEVQRLRQLKAPVLDPAESNWIDSTIADSADATHDIAVLLEPTRIEQEIRNGKLTLGRQLRWKYRDSQRAINKSHRLLACHHSLIGVLNYLQRVDTSLSKPPRTYELDAGLISSASLEVSELEVIPADPARGIMVSSGGNEFKCVVEGPVEEKTMVSSSTKLHTVVGKPAEKNMVGSDALDCEMDDLLAWRRSRGPIADTKLPVLRISREFDTNA